MNVLFLSIVPKGNLYSSLADEFYEHGHNVTFVSSSEEETHFETFGHHRILFFHAGKMLNVSIIRKGINNFLFPHYCLKVIKRYVNPLDYQLILMSTPPLGYCSTVRWLKKKNPSIKFYLILRDIHPEGARFVGLNRIPFLYGYFRNVANAIYHMADVIGCMSPHSVNYIQQEYMTECKEKVKLLPNWGRRIVYTPPQESVRKKYNLEGKYILLYGGNMGISQNLPLFLQLAKDKSFLKDVLFLFIGNGTEREKLRRIVINEGLRNVRIENHIPQQDYNELLKCASVGILSLSPRSFFANCPSKTVSYWQNKIPILASLDGITDHGSYFIERSNSGLWSLASDYVSLSENFDKLYYNKELREQMGENGYRFFLDNYTVDTAYQNLINSLNF